MKQLFAFLAVMLLAACNGHAEPTQSGGCVIGGCSGQLCSPAGKPAISTCEWTEAYACYQSIGQCAMQSNGKCGWNDTPELQNCLKNPEGFRDRTNAQPERGTDPLHPQIYRR